MRHVLTLIAAPGTELNPIEIATMLGNPQWQWIEEGVAADFTMTIGANQVLDYFDQHRIDHIYQPAAFRLKQLLIADMDSTMIDQECLDELAGYMGIKDVVGEITERAMRGEIDFAAALNERVALLKGLPESALLEVYEKQITFTPGGRTLIQTMRAKGAHCVLISGGFKFFTSRVAAHLGFHSDEANRLEVIDGKLTGRVITPILDKNAKEASLRRLAESRNLPLSLSIAIGDGANDIPMLQAAGLGIAYHAKAIVREGAKAAINHNDLTAVLYAQGIPKKDWVKS